MHRMVLLKHTLPDGSWHYDWLLATAGDESGRGALSLLAFRVYVEVCLPSAAAFVALRLRDHRPDYLTYEGEIEGNRGHVARVASGRWRLDQRTDTLITGAVDWGRGARWFEASSINAHWRVRVMATDRPPQLRRRGLRS
ncbi:MAG: hypothetical protein ACF8GE_07810, partial [Phycisphaerales bacterium JB043]